MSRLQRKRDVKRDVNFGETDSYIVRNIDRRKLKPCDDAERSDTIKKILQECFLYRWPCELLSLIESYYRSVYIFWRTYDRTQDRLRIWRRSLWAETNTNVMDAECSPVTEYSTKENVLRPKACSDTYFSLVASDIKSGLCLVILRFDTIVQTLSRVGQFLRAELSLAVVDAIHDHFGQVLTPVGSRALIWTGGWTSCQVPPSLAVIQFDLNTKQFCLGTAPAPFKSHAAVGIDNRYLIVTCEFCYVHDLDLCKWTKLPNLITPRELHGMCVVDQGKHVMVLGGRVCGDDFSTNERRFQSVECGAWDKDRGQITSWRLLPPLIVHHSTLYMSNGVDWDETMHQIGSNEIVWSRGGDYCFGGCAYAMPTHATTEHYSFVPNSD